MNKTLLAIIFGIILISFVSAETIYAGDCLEVNLSELESVDNVVYEVVGNKSNLEGLTIDLNGTIASICIVSNYKPDSFTIIFIDNSTKEIIKEIHSKKTKTITEYVDNIITKWNDITCDEPIICADEDYKKDLNIGFYLWLLINILLIGWIIYIIVKLVQKIRIQKEAKENGKTNTIDINIK